MARLMFIRAGEAMNAHSMARDLGVSQPAVSKALPGLVRAGVISMGRDRATGRLSIRLNRDDHRVVWLKRADNLKQLYETGLVQFFYDRFPEAVVILFGSYAFGEDTVRSDIDIAVISPKERNIDTAAFEKMLQRKITINYYRSLAGIDKHLRNNILNGITLKGAVEL
jgi:predicted nucleotidyltransferase